eukprot:1761701-Pyramimonas_sp.AAC.1
MATLCSSTRSALFGASALAGSIYIYRRFHNASAVPFVYAILADINWLSSWLIACYVKIEGHNSSVMTV